MSQRPTPPTPEELAKRIRELQTRARPGDYIKPGDIDIWAMKARAELAEALAQQASFIASYLEELSTLRRQLAEADAVVNDWAFGRGLDGAITPTHTMGQFATYEAEALDRHRDRHASRTERTP